MNKLAINVSNKPSTSTLRRVLVIALITVVLLLIPLIANQLTDDVTWGALDFTVMGLLIFGIRLLIDLAIRKTGKYRTVTIIGLVILFMYGWAELAVGVFTNVGN